MRGKGGIRLAFLGINSSPWVKGTLLLQDARADTETAYAMEVGKSACASNKVIKARAAFDSVRSVCKI